MGRSTILLEEFYRSIGIQKSRLRVLVARTADGHLTVNPGGDSEGRGAGGGFGGDLWST